MGGFTPKPPTFTGAGKAWGGVGCYNGPSQLFVMKEQHQPVQYSHAKLDSEERAFHKHWDEIDLLRERGDLQGAIRRLGLGANAVWQDVYEALGEQERRLWAAKLRLPLDVPAEEIDAILLERKRAELIAELRLPADTTWEELNNLGLVRWLYVRRGFGR